MVHTYKYFLFILNACQAQHYQMNFMTPMLIKSPHYTTLVTHYLYIPGILLMLYSTANYNHSFTHSHIDDGVHHAG